MRAPPSAVAAEQTIKRIDPIEPSDFFVRAIGSQQIAYPSLRRDDT